MNLSHDTITAYGALSPESRDTLNVQWILTQDCNSRCSYCVQWVDAWNTVYVKERVLEMAYKILEDRRPHYSFTFTGGEPTLHPHLTDVLEYLYRSRISLNVEVETNGLRSLDYYRELVSLARNDTLQLTISAHLHKITLESLCCLVALVVENKQHAHVRLVFDPEQRETMYLFHTALVQLRAVVPFTLVIWPLMRAENPLEVDARYTQSDLDWCTWAQEAFESAEAASAQITPKPLPRVLPQFQYQAETGEVCCCTQNSVDLKPKFTGFSCCAGTNFLRINADGTFQGALCRQGREQRPLWKEESHISQAAQLLTCSSGRCVEACNAVLPKFRNKDDAEAWLGDYEERTRSRLWEKNSAPHPFHPAPTTEDIVRNRLKRLEPACATCVRETPQPEFFPQHRENITIVYAALADEESREVFLRRLKLLETGNTGYLRESAYPVYEHPEMPLYPEDIDYLESGEGYCRILRLDAGTDNLALLQEQEVRILYYQPKLQISLAELESCLDIPLLLLEKFKGYSLYMGQHGPEASDTCLYALPPVLPKHYPAFPAELADKLPLVSIIVPTHNNEDTLKRCLDSALIQGVERMELIVIDDASTDKTPEIIAEYVRRYPKIVRSMRFAENRGAGPARNMGMDMACGQYMAFIDSDDMLAEDFLSRGLEVMTAEDADIVAFDMVINRDGEEVLWGVEPGSWSGEDSLRQLLLKKAGGYGTVCRLYRTHMLRRYAVCYSDTTVHQDMFFSVKAFYYLRKSVVLPEVGYYRYVRKGSNSGANHGDKKVIAFISFVGFLTRFFVAHGLNTDTEMYRYCIKKVYDWDRNSIFDIIFDADKQGRLEELLTEERLLELGSSKEALCCILADYALLHCHRKDLHPTVAPEDLDWEAAAAAPRPPKTYTAYGNADTPDGPAPILSVIVPNYNKDKYLAKCLDSILCQTMQDFELIIIDDASTDSSWDMLRDYADQNPCIRLYRMDYNNRQGVGRNIGIEKARGEYITFIDSDDYPLRHFFALGVEEIVKNQCDVVVFSTQILFENGECRECHITSKHIRGAQAFTQYLKGGFEPAPHGKIFSRDFIITNHICFPDHIYHQDQMFIADVFWKSNSILFVDNIVYTNVQSSDSSIRPATRRYLHLHSAYTFYAYFQQAGTRLYSYDGAVAQCGNHVAWNIENVFLAACAAFLKATGAIPMAKEDHILLRPCSLFFRALLLGYARCRAAGSIPDGVLPQPLQLLHEDYTPTPAVCPLVSVIIPTYNQEDCIERCLKSVLTQSLRSLEVIVVNDASTDKTLDLCLAWQQKDARVRVFSNEQNMGQGYSRNKALEVAQGKYITYVDSDDYILPNFLLRGVSILEHNDKIDFVCFNIYRKNDNNVVVQFDKDTGGVFSGKEMFIRYCKRETNALGPVSKIYNTKYLKTKNINFSNIRLFEDVLFMMTVYNSANNILFENEYAYSYMQHIHPASAENFIKVLPKRIDSIFSYAREIHTFCIKYFFQKEAKELSYAKCDGPMWQLHRSLSGIASFINTAISPLTDQNMQDLAAAPEFLRRILNDYARLHALHTNDTGDLPPEDLDPQYQRPEPADYLIPVPFHPEQPEPIRLSVIIPAYRVAPYLARCLDSVLSQNVDGMEIILVEDCTRDDETLALCEQYARNYPEIRFFRTPWNSGLGTVRNLAMQQARGTYLTFVDSDDWMASDFLCRGLPLLQENPHCEVADFSYYDWDDTENKQITFNRMPHGLVVDGTKAIELYVHGTYRNFCTVSKLYHTDFICKKNIGCGKKFNEDEAFLLHCYSAVTRVMFYDMPAYYYVRKSASTTIMRPSCRGKQYFESTLENLRIVHDILGKDMSAQGQKNYKRRIKSYTWGHHKDNILHYIHACNVHKLPSPLTDNVLETLTLSKEYLRNLIMDYAVLSQKPLPQKKEN